MYVNKQLTAIWQKCIERAPLAQGIMTLQCNCKASHYANGTIQRSIELLRGSTTRLNKPLYAALTQVLWQNTIYLHSTAWWNK